MRIVWGLLFVFSGVMFGLTACHVIEPRTYDLEVACGFTAVSLFFSGIGHMIGVEE